MARAPGEGAGNPRIPPPMWVRIQRFIDEHPEEGFETPTEFVRHVIREYLRAAEGGINVAEAARRIDAPAKARRAPGRSKRQDAGD